MPDKTIDYLVAPQNWRIGKKLNGTLQKTCLYQDALRPVAELKADGTLRAVFLYGDKANVPAAMEINACRGTLPQPSLPHKKAHPQWGRLMNRYFRAVYVVVSSDAG